MKPLPKLSINSVLVSVVATAAAVGIATRDVWWGLATAGALMSLLLGLFKMRNFEGMVRRHHELTLLERAEARWVRCELSRGDVRAREQSSIARKPTPVPEATEQQLEQSIFAERTEASDALLAAIAASLPHLERVLDDVQSHWQAQDLFYRFYHQSFKVYRANETTEKIVRELQALAPDRPLHEWFVGIVADATSRRFVPAVNGRWPDETRPVIEALLHARMFLELVVEVGRVPPPPTGLSIPSGWAAVLTLYGLR